MCQESCTQKRGGVAQLARANGSYPLGRWFEPTRRYHFGPLVKRLRHRPFTAVTRVQISYGSPYGSIAQLGEHLPYKQRVIGSSPIVPTIRGPVVQLVRTLACHARGQGFESPSGRH